MDVAIGWPITVPGAPRDQVLEFAKRADAAGFSSLGTIDRLVYPNYEPLVSLGAAAAVTERIRLATTILIVPYRGVAAVVAKQAATVNALSGGRLVLGLAVGGREDDYEAAGIPFGERGKRMDQMLADMTRIWEGDAIGPPGAPTLILGGSVQASFARAARYGDGWSLGGGTPEMLADGKARAEAAWKEAGREGSPRIAAIAYYSLGPQAEENAQSYLGDYYGFLGEIADQIVAGAAKDADTVKAYIAGFEAAGCDELFLSACSPDPEQVDRLAEAAL